MKWAVSHATKFITLSTEASDHVRTFRSYQSQQTLEKSSRKIKSLFVNEDKSNAFILHAITISLTTAIWKILPERGDHLTFHLWPNPVSPLGAPCNHNDYLCSRWTQMLKKAEGITKSSQTWSHTAPLIERTLYSQQRCWRILSICFSLKKDT